MKFEIKYRKETLTIGEEEPKEIVEYTHFGSGDVQVKCNACNHRLCANCHDILTSDDDLFCVICSESCSTISYQLAHKQLLFHEYQQCIEEIK